MTDDLSRRHLLAGCAAVALPGALGRLAYPAEAAEPGRVDAVPTSVTRTWLAPQYWANRLSDWRLHLGRLECLTAGPGLRTVGVLPRSLAPGALAGAVEVRTGTLGSGAGFSGFLVGTGAGLLHWKAAALVMSASGQGGGLLAVYDSDGLVRFREHTDEQHPFAYAALPSEARTGPAPARRPDEDVTLRLQLVPDGAGAYDLELTARATATGAVLSRTVRRRVPAAQLVGGLSLVSGATGAGGARHWLQGLRTEGPKLAVHARSAGPVLGTLYSLSGSVLKLTAQLMPIGATDPRRVVLQARPAAGGSWRTVQEVAVGAGSCATFRVTDWDGTRAWSYRVGWALGTAQESFYGGTIRAEPAPRAPLSIGMLNCTIHAYRNLDVESSGTPRLPGEAFQGLYTGENLYFPYAETAQNLLAADPDLVVALGDQYYEQSPTRRGFADPLLDVLGKYYLWLWSFGDLTRSRPTLCLVDDHDVFQGNLWGWSGRAAPGRDAESGGYVMQASWVNAVQRVQCAHNPDPYDPTPVLQGISVYYAAFSYGGVSFALLEDRKFKDTNKSGTDGGLPLTGPRQLLGARQEQFLRAWRDLHPGQPKVCLTQTAFACVQTGPDGEPVADPDSNGTPVAGRRTAVQLLAAAHALVLSGDQHLGSLVRHGLTTWTDGPLQFTAPATGSSYQRWFAPARPLANPRGPGTGDFTDGFGNRFRVLAVANPRVTARQVYAVQRQPKVGDRELKREGYGLVEVDKAAQQFRLHCWPWRYGPAQPGPGEYPGWPYVLPFGAA